MNNMRFRFTPGFWRAAVGFLTGIIVAWAAAWAFIYDAFSSTSVLMRMAGYLVYPIHGFAVVIEWMLPDAVILAGGPVVTTVLLLLYPALFAAAFFLGGAKQTRKIIISEACLAVAFIALACISASIVA